MSRLRIPACRRIVLGATPPIRTQQRRWAQVHDVRFLSTHQSDRVLDKYREKLHQKAKGEGLKDIGELKEAYAAKIQELKKKAAIEIPSVDGIPTASSSSSSSPILHDPPPPPPITPDSSSSTPQIPASSLKTLSAYLDLSKSRRLPGPELEAIWRLRHASNPRSLCATIPQAIFKGIAANARRYPHFVLPVPRPVPEGAADAGAPAAEMHFLQWTFPAPDTVTVIFTHLAEFKLRGEYAQPHTTLTHHLELAADTDLVLLQGHVTEGRGVSLDEAKWLVMCLQKFYGTAGQTPARKRLLDMFVRGDEAFRVEELLEEVEKTI